MRLPTSAEMAPLAPFAGVDLSKQAVRTQEAVFKLGTSAQASDTQRNSFQINYEAFDEARVRYLQLDSIDVWSLTTVGNPPAVDSVQFIPPLPHVFHIHINPFQVWRAGPTGAGQWVWKDTQIIPADTTVTVYTQYTDFTGTFVIHCHILDHEDLGMMEAVEVVRELPQPHPAPNTNANANANAAGGMGGAAGGHAHGHAAPAGATHRH
jgi:hypothetical protein